MLKQVDNPEMLWPTGASIDDITSRWWVAHTKARCEKAFAHDLAALGIAYFLPMIKRTTYSGGRRRVGLVPLFNSYVFFAGDERQRHTALLTDRLSAVLEVHDQENLRRELSAAHRIVTGEVSIDLYPFAAVGKRVRVARGAFEGIEGVVVQRDGTERFVVEVSILGQGAALEIAPELLEPVESALTQRRAS